MHFATASLSSSVGTSGRGVANLRHDCARPKQFLRSRVPASTQQQQHRGNSIRVASSSMSETHRKSALILEVDGALIDIHMDGHRVAFNRAFANLGFDCVCWTTAVYNDLLSSGDGTAEGLVTAYFNAVGWPLSTPTNERHIFAAKVHQIKRDAFKQLLKERKIPIREAVDQVIASALQDGAVVALIAGTRSEDGAGVANVALSQLHPDIASQVRVFTTSMLPEQNNGADRIEQPPIATSITGMLQQAQAAMKQREASAFVNSLQQAGGSERSGSSLKVAVDPNLSAAGKRQVLSAEWLAAIGATLDVPMARCLLLGGQNSTLQAAGSAGMIPVAIPRRMALQGTYPNVRAKFEGFGVGLATWPRLRSLLHLTQ